MSEREEKIRGMLGKYRDVLPSSDEFAASKRGRLTWTTTPPNARSQWSNPMRDTVEEVGSAVRYALAEVQAMFRPGVYVTFVMRNPDAAEGELVISNDPHADRFVPFVRALNGEASGSSEPLG